MCFPMSLRWTLYVAPKPPEGAQKRTMAVFRVDLQLQFTWRKSATNILSQQVCTTHYIGWAIHSELHTSCACLLTSACKAGRLSTSLQRGPKKAKPSYIFAFVFETPRPNLIIFGTHEQQFIANTLQQTLCN